MYLALSVLFRTTICLFDRKVSLNRSATFEMGNTKVIAAVYGPHEVSTTVWGFPLCMNFIENMLKFSICQFANIIEYSYNDIFKKILPIKMHHN